MTTRSQPADFILYEEYTDKEYPVFRKFLEIMHTDQLQTWLGGVLADERRRATLRSLLDQYELPVIQVGWKNQRGNPIVVASSPAGTTLSGIELNPSSATMSPGDIFSTSIWGIYTNGISSLLYIPSGQVNYTSSNPNVATVDSNGTITMNSFGNATIFAGYDGFSAQMLVTSPAPSITSFSGIQNTNKTFQLSFTGTVGTTNIIEASTNLVNWVPIATLDNTNGFLQFLDITASNYPVRFYRVMIANAGSTAILPFVWISSQSLQANGVFQFSITGTAGATNIIQASTNLVSWITLQTLLNTNGSIFFVDQSATNSRQKFYRVVIPQ